MSPLTRLVITLLLSMPALGSAQAQMESPQQTTPEESVSRESQSAQGDAEESAPRAPARQTGRNQSGDAVEEGGLALSAYANTDDTTEFQLGFGGRLDSGLGYFYIGHFETLSRASVSSGSAANGLIPENRYRSTRIGLYAEGHDASTGEGFGFGTFLYHNRSELVIDRYGLGATLDLAYVAAERVRLSGGVDLMPEYLSTDWDSRARLEYEWHADLRVLVHPKVDIGVNWRAGRTNDRSLSTRQYEEVTAGFRLIF